jgi:MFS family permease
MGIILMLEGMFFIALSVLADYLKFGHATDIFGWKQISVLIFGIALFLAGIVSLTIPHNK